jgi:hypothetical protein
MNNKITQDVAFGLNEEERMHLILQVFFQENLTKTSEYASMDWVGESGVQYELKARKVKKNQFDTTIIPASKLDNLEKGVFIFKFLDGVFYIVYDKELFKTFVNKPVYCDARYGNPNRDHIHIPVSLLKSLN